MNWLFIAIPTGIAGLSFLWLLIQTVRSGPIGWLSAVGVPGLLLGNSGYALLTNSGPVLPAGAGASIGGFVLALLAGFLFDLSSSLKQGPEELLGRRSPGPLILWGVAMLGYVVAPVGGYLEGWQTTVERWSGALVLVSACALAGQALNWVRRLLQAIPAPVSAAEAAVPRGRGGVIGGALAALAAFGLLLLG